MPDALESVKALVADYRRFSQNSEGEDPKRAKRQATTAANLQSVVEELEIARKRLRAIPKSYGDLSDLPEEVMAQLSLAKVDELEQQMRDIVASGDGAEVSLDAIIIELFRRHNVIEQRKFIMNKLYRMAQKGTISSVEGKKGAYYVPTASPHSYPSFDNDLDDEVPF